MWWSLRKTQVLDLNTLGEGDEVRIFLHDSTQPVILQKTGRRVSSDAVMNVSIINATGDHIGLEARHPLTQCLTSMLAARRFSVNGEPPVPVGRYVGPELHFFLPHPDTGEAGHVHIVSVEINTQSA